MEHYRRKGLPWALGKDVSECTTSREVMEQAKLDWTVRKCTLNAKMPFSLYSNNMLANQVDENMGDFVKDGFIYKNCPNAYATYRTDIQVPLGLVKSKYEVVQNIDAFNFFDNSIGEGKAIWQHAGCVGNGEQIYVSAKLPVTSSINGDPIENYLVFSNTHDGTMSVTVMFTPVRMFCSNMLNAGLNKSDAYIRLRHTESVKEKLEKGAEVLRIACEYAKTSKELYSALYATRMSDDDVMVYISNLILSESEVTSLTKYNDTPSVYDYKRLLNREYSIMERTGISMRKINQINSIFDYYMNGIAQEKIIGTAWGAYNAITGYYSNVVDNPTDKRFNSLLFGTGQNVMQKAMVNAYEISRAA